MTDLRALAEQDLFHTIEGEFAIPVVLITPAGERIAKTVDGRPLGGRVLWSHKEISPETSEPYIVHSPVVVLRESSLSKVPKSAEVWGVVIPEGPRPGAPLKHYVTDVSGIVEPGRNMGTVTLFLVEAEDNGEELGDG